MKKSTLQKPIKQILAERGFAHVKGDSYAVDLGDGKTKIILGIPSGKNGRGFVFGVQFADLGPYDGLIAHAVMRQYDYAYELAYPESYEYTDLQIQEVVRRLLADYEIYLREGVSAIRKRIDAWTFGDLSDASRDTILRYLGLDGTDPYSMAYRDQIAEQMVDGGSMCLPLSEYLGHKDFYDSYLDCNAKICIDQEREQVTIQFFAQRKWYQQ